MGRLARSAVVWRALLALVMSVPATGAARDEESGDTVDISVTVLPAAPEGTVSAALAGGSPADLGPELDRLAMGLLVVRDRPLPGAWQITVSQAPPPRDDALLWLLGYGERATNVGRVSRVSIGQPLTRPTPILVAAPGSMPQVSWVPLTVGAAPGVWPEPRLMLVTMASAP